MENEFTAMTNMETTKYKLNLQEIHAVMLFLRDYDWKPVLDGDKVVAKYIYNTASQLYNILKKRGLRLVESKNDKRVNIALSELEILTIAILAKVEHENHFVKYAINKIIMDMPIEIINVLEKANTEHCPQTEYCHEEND